MTGYQYISRTDLRHNGWEVFEYLQDRPHVEDAHELMACPACDGACRPMSHTHTRFRQRNGLLQVWTGRQWINRPISHSDEAKAIEDMHLIAEDSPFAQVGHA